MKSNEYLIEEFKLVNYFCFLFLHQLSSHVRHQTGTFPIPPNVTSFSNATTVSEKKSSAVTVYL